LSFSILIFGRVARAAPAKYYRAALSHTALADGSTELSSPRDRASI
jgi:hypothetical protein